MEAVNRKKLKAKGKAFLYSAFRETSTQGDQVWITHSYPCKLHHTCLYLANVRQMVPPERQTSDSARYSFIDPGRMKGWVGLVGWPSGRYTHISCHTCNWGRFEAIEYRPLISLYGRRQPVGRPGDQWWTRQRSRRRVCEAEKIHVGD